MPEEARLRSLRQLPAQAAPPQQTRQAGVRLGTADADALDLEAKALFSEAELRAKADLAVQRRIEAGIGDSVQDAQPLKPPEFDQSLVGKRIEVLWRCARLA